MDLCELEDNLVYRVSSRTARSVTERNPVLEGKKMHPFIITVAVLQLSVTSGMTANIVS